jgi:hypothetical protein
MGMVNQRQAEDWTESLRRGPVVNFKVEGERITTEGITAHAPENVSRSKEAFAS